MDQLKVVGSARGWLPQERSYLRDGASKGAVVSSSGGSGERTGELRERNLQIQVTRTEAVAETDVLSRTT